jgi:hypothetical protein
VCLPKGIVSGWWFQPSEKYQLGCADIPNTWKNEIHVPNHQPGFLWVLNGLHNYMFFLWFAYGIRYGFRWMIYHICGLHPKKKHGLNYHAYGIEKECDGDVYHMTWHTEPTIHG